MNSPLKLTNLFWIFEIKAGSGKSSVVNTLVTCVRRMFGYKNVIQIYAPTGGAAANAGGRTIHNGLKVRVSKRKQCDTNELKGQRKIDLMRELQHTLISVFDEFSMINASVFEQAQNNCRVAAHNGTNHTIPWGGIPIIVLSGDAMQLPSIGTGICDMPSRKIDKKERLFDTATMNGLIEFQQFQDHTSVLTTGKRQNDDQREFVDLLQAARNDLLT